LAAEAAFAPPLWVHAVVWSIVILAGALLLLRPFKGVLITLQYHHKAGEEGSIDYDP
jgi:uncharacterized protein (DUF983 family)